MRKKLLGATLLVALIAAVVAVAPALTAPNETLSVRMTAEAPAAPCVMFASNPGTQVDFGTLPFSNPRDALVGSAASPISPRYSNCGTATEHLFISATDARNFCTSVCVVKTWVLNGGRAECPALNAFQLWYGVDNVGSSPVLSGITYDLRKLGEPNEPSNYAPGEAHDLRLQIRMPCEGSDGAGEDFRFNVTVTAAVA